MVSHFAVFLALFFPLFESRQPSSIDLIVGCLLSHIFSSLQLLCLPKGWLAGYMTVMNLLITFSCFSSESTLTLLLGLVVCLLLQRYAGSWRASLTRVCRRCRTSSSAATLSSLILQSRGRTTVSRCSPLETVGCSSMVPKKYS